MPPHGLDVSQQMPSVFIYVCFFVIGMTILSAGIIGWLIQDLVALRRRRRDNKVNKAKNEIRARLRRLKEQEAHESANDDLLIINWEASYNEFWRDR